MGIPAAFRWLSNKYPKIISSVVESQPLTMEDGQVIPVDATSPNPNGEEFDNLYLDMNGIVHPCSHPEDRPAPKDEEEMMLEIFRYTDRVVNMVRPRKLLMIAIDGVAPRAKMNQQRSRRFRSAQEAKEKEEDKQELLKLLKQQNGGKISAASLEEVVKKAFDSNSITPGTPFMDILAASLRYWCAYKLNTDPAWATMKIIISDASVPGEGEHKIMDFVRSQRGSPDHNPDTRHVIYGLDADLIMLSLATHEPHFRVLREDVFFQDAKAKMCKLCGQKGHDARDCRGEAKEKDGEHDEKDKPLSLKPFIWLHVSVLREYLAVELDVPDLPFRWDIERAIDDWIFLCCFVGNDFLPHLPALEIRENGINTLTALWKENLPHMGGYVTKDGHVDLERAQVIMNGLGKQEDAIFRKRKTQEDRREENNKRRRLQDEANGRGGRGGKRGGRGGLSEESPFAKSTSKDRFFAEGVPAGLNFHQFDNMPVAAPQAALTHDMVVNRPAVQKANLANKSAASILKGKLAKGPIAPDAADDAATANAEAGPTTPSALGKRKASMLEEDGASTPAASTPGTPAGDEMPADTVRMWETGYASRYYEQKFKVSPDDTAFRHKVAHSYVEGLAWVLLYYFQGCPSWEWYYPYHYAPFAADFVDLDKMSLSFEKGRTSKPFEQLMSVLPAGSRDSIPEIFHDLMLNPDSPIIDFYPEDFELDLNGKKFAWQGVALLPFIDMPRLLDAVEGKYPLLSEKDRIRNERGRVVMLLSDAHPTFYDAISANFYSKKQGAPKFKLDTATSDGLAGKVEKIPDYLPHGALTYPLERKSMPDLEYDHSLSVYYDIPVSNHPHKSMLLRGVTMPPPMLTHSDKEELKGKMNGRDSGRSYGGRGGRGDRNNYRGGRGGGGQRDYDNRQDSYRPNIGYGGNQNSYPQPPPSWIPPPPGMPGFGVGPPPPMPPPPAHYGGRDNRRDGYQGGGGYQAGGGGYQGSGGGYQGGGGGYQGGGSQGGGYQGGPQGGYQQGAYGGNQGYGAPPGNYQGQGYNNRNDGRQGGGRGGYNGNRNSRGYHH